MEQKNRNRFSGGNFEKKPKNESFFSRESASAAETETDRPMQNPNLIIGRNAVSEALKSDRDVESIWVARGMRVGSIVAILAKAKEKGVPIKEVDEKKLNFTCPGENHQGVIAFAAAHNYATLEDLFAKAAEKQEAPFFVICDELEDPHNLGAILRTAECAGAHGVIIPRRRSVGLTYAVGKASAGAVEYMPVVRVTNLTDTIEELKKRGVWVYAADMDGENWCSTDLTGPCALVIGSEGFGVGRLVKEHADVVLSLPIKGKINSLNASVACGILCYEVCRQRSGIPAKNRK